MLIDVRRAAVWRDVRDVCDCDVGDTGRAAVGGGGGGGGSASAEAGGGGGGGGARRDAAAGPPPPRRARCGLAVVTGAWAGTSRLAG